MFWMDCFSGHLTAKSDVYSFGVVLLELLTGRRSMDKTRPNREQNLVDWARPFLNSARKLSRIMDPRLEGQYSSKAAQKAAELAYLCLSSHPKHRPLMRTIVETLEPLQDMLDDIPMAHFVYTVATPQTKTQDDGESKTVEEEKIKRHHRHRHQLHGQRHRNRSSPAVAALSEDATVYKKYGNGAPRNSPEHRL